MSEVPLYSFPQRIAGEDFAGQGLGIEGWGRFRSKGLKFGVRVQGLGFGVYGLGVMG